MAGRDIKDPVTGPSIGRDNFGTVAGRDINNNHRTAKIGPGWWIAIIALLLAATGGSVYWAAEDNSDQGDNSSQTPSVPASREAVRSPSTASASGLLYADKSVTLSNAWAVKRDCPIDVYLEITDRGPQISEWEPARDGGVAAWPVLEWTPPCSRMNHQINFDNVPVAKVSGPQTQSSCQASAQNSLSNGTALDGYGVRALAIGDQFCEDFGPRGLVILMRVVGLTGSPATEIDWSVTAWAGTPAAERNTPPGGVVYAGKAFAVGDEIADANDCAVAYVSIFGDTPSVKYDRGVGFGKSADITYFPTCLGGNGKVRLRQYVAPVNGNVGVSACEDAAVRADGSSLDVEVTELRAGMQYCQYSSDLDSVALVKVTALTTSSPASIEFSVTHWKAPDAQ
ncbi:hypothetical protein [Streptomyces sp. NPDC059479]|uniref:hypothetical protein n=1 Tax=Streptomyces sp. NPDC059479 TaxID=3346848 RepID=UPI0036B83811